MSSTSDIYKFKMYLFYHGYPDGFLFFIHNFNMTLRGNRDAVDGHEYLVSLYACLWGKSHQFSLFYSDVENTETLKVCYYIKSLAWYFPL